MSVLSRLFGRRPETPPAAGGPPPPPPRADSLCLSGDGFAGADLTGPATVTVTLGDRTFTATATRRGVAHPAEFALTEIHEVVAEEPAEVVAEIAPEPEPEVVADESPGVGEIAVVRRPITNAASE